MREWIRVVLDAVNNMSNNKQIITTDENFEYIKSNSKTLRILKKIYGDCATDKTATFQVPKKKIQGGNK